MESAVPVERAVRSVTMDKNVNSALSMTFIARLVIDGTLTQSYRTNVSNVKFLIVKYARMMEHYVKNATRATI